MSVTRLVLMKFFGITYAPLLIILVLISGLMLPMIFYTICLRLNLWWLFTLKKPVEDIGAITGKNINIS